MQRRLRWLWVLFGMLGSLAYAETTEVPQMQAVSSYVRLMKGESLPLERFLISDAKKQVEEKFLKKTPLPFFFDLRPMTAVPEGRLAKWKRSKERMTRTLQEAGYDTRSLPTLGEGTFLALVAPDVALLLAWVDQQKTKDAPKKLRGTLLVLWLHQGVWKIAAAGNSPARWMAKNRPPAEAK